MVGNTTLLIGTEDDKVEDIVKVLSKYCASRKQMNPTSSSFGRGLEHHGLPEDVIVGGATYFVLNVEHFGKI